MSRTTGSERIRVKGKGMPMDGEEMEMDEPDPMAIQVAEETVCTSASATPLGGQGPTGIGPPLRASARGDGQLWPVDAKSSNGATQPTPPQALSQRRRQELQQIQVHLNTAKLGSS